MANSGFARLAKGCDKNFLANFSGFDYIVAPSGSSEGLALKFLPEYCYNSL